MGQALPRSPLGLQGGGVLGGDSRWFFLPLEEIRQGGVSVGMVRTMEEKEQARLSLHILYEEMIHISC